MCVVYQTGYHAKGFDSITGSYLTKPVFQSPLLEKETIYSIYTSILTKKMQKFAVPGLVLTNFTKPKFSTS